MSLTRWTKSAKECYAREILASLYKIDRCSAYIMGQPCHYSDMENCKMYDFVQKIYKIEGAPKGFPQHAEWSHAGYRFSVTELEIINHIKSNKTAVSVADLAKNTSVDISQIPTRISIINRKKKGFIRILKKNRHSYYCLGQED